MKFRPAGSRAARGRLAGGSIGRWTLRFEGEALEAAYRDYRIEQSLGEIRTWGAFAFLAFACFGIVEWFVISADLRLAYIVRYAIGQPLLLAALLAVNPRFKRHIGTTVLFSFVVGGATTLTMFSIASFPENFIYPGILGLMILTMYGNMGPRFIHTAALSWLVLAAYAALSVLIVTGHEQRFLVLFGMLLVVLNVVVMFTAYNHEIVIRRAFRNQVLLRRQTEHAGKMAERAMAAEDRLRVAFDDSVAQNAAFLQTVLANITEALCTFDKYWRLTLVNEQFPKLLDIPRRLCETGTPLGDLVRYLAKSGEFGQNDVEDLMQRFVALVETGEHQYYEHTRPDGRVVEIRTSPLPGGGLVATLVDATERKRAEKELMQFQKMESLGNLSGGIAHNLNNLLLPMLALSKRTASELPEGEVQRERLEKVVQAAERARSLVQQIVEFSREEDVSSEDHDILENMQESMALVRSTLPSTIKLSEWFGENVGRVRGDPAQTATVLMNLITNSIDAMAGTTGVLDISLSRTEVDPSLVEMIRNIEPGLYARLTVVDTGVGMDDTTLSRIFDPFFTTKAVGEGTGLGLSTAYAIVSRQGGTIKISSRPGTGTTVDVYWPLIDNESVRPSSAMSGSDHARYLH